MNRIETIFSIDNLALTKKKVLKWAQSSDTVLWLDSNNHSDRYSSYEAVIAIGVHANISTSYDGAFDKLKKFQSATRDYIFGYLSYDLKNDTETLTSNNHDELAFADMFFFQPEKIIFLSKENIIFKYLSDTAAIDYKNILATDLSKNTPKNKTAKIKLRTQHHSYLNKVETILQEIHYGELYEATFCQEFYAENTEINALDAYNNLNKISHPPFASFFKTADKYLLSASPERYLQKKGNTLISQPIKGTAKRAKTSEEDIQLIEHLQNDPKERAENIMIVDLVRNDLSKFSKKGTTKVAELCGIYTFKQVHQMISTITTEVEDNTHPVDIIRSTFPMGSMTGAPKVAAMKIIEREEDAKRGLFSGSVGYFTPQGDFDFNVIIRSILYNETKKYVSFSVGSAITSLASPEKEWEECLLKAKAMREVLS